MIDLYFDPPHPGWNIYEGIIDGELWTCVILEQAEMFHSTITIHGVKPMVFNSHRGYFIGATWSNDRLTFPVMGPFDTLDEMQVMFKLVGEFNDDD